jgi:probable rRNA maturation factor
VSIDLDLQMACNDKNLPSKDDFQLWVNTALLSYNKTFELTVRIVNIEESQSLNKQYRSKDKPTNVLSFPFEVPEGIELALLGDLVICAEVVRLEAQQQNKHLHEHWAHMVIHGCLHLLGFDHIEDNDAQEMEALEIKLLSTLKINDPYQLI